MRIAAGFADPAMTAPAAVAAGPRDMVRSVIYGVSGRQPVPSAVWSAFNASPLGPASSTASTLLGAARLGCPGQLVEPDRTAPLAG